MRLLIRNKWFSLRGSSYIRDENENDYLKVQGRFWTFTSKKFLKDLNGNDLYMIRNKFWYLFHRQAFVFDMEGNIVAHLSRKIFSFHDHYNITSTLHGNIVIRGNILGYDYHIYENDVEIGHVARKISLRDSYVLDINDDSDINFYCALVIAIDNIVDRMRSDGNSFMFTSGD